MNSVQKRTKRFDDIFYFIAEEHADGTVPMLSEIIVTAAALLLLVDRR